MPFLRMYASVGSSLCATRLSSHEIALSKPRGGTWVMVGGERTGWEGIETPVMKGLSPRSRLEVPVMVKRVSALLEGLATR